MNAVINLAAAKANRPNLHQNVFDEFVTQSVELNRDMLISTIKNLKNYEPSYIINSVALQIVSATYTTKTHQELLEAISGGTIFRLKDSLQKAFEADLSFCELLRGGDNACELI